MSRRFLTAQWRHLCLFTYTCPEELLLPHCPPGTHLELFEGHAHVSLVAFDFLETRVFGVGWPGFRHFPEVNLRFYVTDGERRGVVFVREFVPSRFVAWLARRLYNEPYVATNTASEVLHTGNSLSVGHQLHRAGTDNTLHVVADSTSHLPASHTLEHHFKEHQWGFGKTQAGGQAVYEVRHPHWEIFPVKSCTLDWNWEHVYGPEWAFLSSRDPVSVILAAGSEIEVFFAE